VEREVVKKIAAVESCEELIDGLRDWQKEGKLVSMMVVFFDNEGNINTHWSNIPSVTRAVGAIERLKISLCADAGDT
jgi:hypothetical protein